MHWLLPSPPLRYLLDVHADANGRLPQSWQSTGEETLAFQRPGLICVIEMTFAIIGSGLAIWAYHDGGIVILWIRRPFQSRVYLLWIACKNGALMLECRGPGP